MRQSYVPEITCTQEKARIQDRKMPSGASAQSLHPLLQGALASLDWQLEGELVRYRRLRALGKTGYKSQSVSHSVSRRKVSSGPDAILGAKFLDRDRLSSVGAGDIGEAGSSVDRGAIASESSQLPGQIPSFDLNAVPGDVPVSDAPVIGEPGITSQSPNASFSSPDLSESWPLNADSSDSNSLDSTSLELKRLTKQYASKVMDEGELLGTLDEEAPNDYLESSEALLKSLAEEEAEVQAEQGFLQNLMTPLGLGSMLLLLISSGMFGFVIVNPGNLSQLWAVSKGRSEVHPVNSDQASPRSLTEVPQPNLASREFPELNLQTLGSLKMDGSDLGLLKGVSGPEKSLGQSSGSKTANLGATGSSGIAVLKEDSGKEPEVSLSREPVASRLGPDLPFPGTDAPSPRRLIPDVGGAVSARSQEPLPPARNSYPRASERYQEPLPPARRSVPAPSRPPSEPIPAYPVAPRRTLPLPPPVPTAPPIPVTVESAPLPPSTPPVTSKSDGYKVVTPYTSDRSLEQAREKVPDAYLHNYSDGAKVQLGSFNDETSAQQQAEALKKQGIPAEVYKP